MLSQEEIERELKRLDAKIEVLRVEVVKLQVPSMVQSFGTAVKEAVQKRTKPKKEKGS